MNAKLAHSLMAALLLLTGCGGGQESKTANDREHMCEVTKDFARSCYDDGGPDVTCDQLRAVVGKAADSHNLDASFKSVLVELCSKACEARKSGQTWSALNERMDCAKFAAN